ncbi:hypothetical protein Hamer_G021127 [Homarus americanus]|uniref:Uncharacterized protein n=1 Tax=Homarus americanus TaxID=6706 RepID=A0A8J5JAG5_HOMAM|nr:hypothetical protein Hamer_G021127 [Homarus americanus]
MMRVNTELQQTLLARWLPASTSQQNTTLLTYLYQMFPFLTQSYSSGAHKSAVVVLREPGREGESESWREKERAPSASIDSSSDPTNQVHPVACIPSYHGRLAS